MRHRRVLSYIVRRVFLIALVAAGGVISAGFLTDGPGVGEAQPVAEITELDCESDPELVVITNTGTADLAMSGWNLQSDPPTQESLPLSSFVSLMPGGSIFIESGPSAEGTFVWSREFIFRDGDPTDYARLASDAGEVLLTVNCQGGAATATASATASPSATTTALSPASTPASPTVAQAVQAPTGGGPPLPSSNLLSPALVTVLGGFLAAAGVAGLALPALGSLASKPRGTAAAEPEQPAPAPTGRRERSPSGTRSDYLLMIAIVLVVLALLAILLGAGEKQRR